MGAIAVLDVHDYAHATGGFLPTPARVLPLRTPALTVRHPDGSTAQISPGGRIRQHGPRQLGDDIAALHELWRTTGSPPPRSLPPHHRPAAPDHLLDDPYRPSIGACEHTNRTAQRSR